MGYVDCPECCGTGEVWDEDADDYEPTPRKPVEQWWTEEEAQAGREFIARFVALKAELGDEDD